MCMNEDRRQGPRDQQGIDELSVPSEGEHVLSPDKVLSAVANEQRRAIIGSLNDAPEKTLDYDALVDRVAEAVRDEDVGRPDEHRQRVRIALRHTHLPKLEEIQVIDYEADTGHIQFVGDELVEEVLELVELYDTDE